MFLPSLAGFSYIRYSRYHQDPESQLPLPQEETPTFDLKGNLLPRPIRRYPYANEFTFRI